MDFKELIEKAIEDGITEVKTVGYDSKKEAAAIAGFEKCHSLGSIEQFQAELERCNILELGMRDAHHEEEDKQKQEALLEDYWAQRYFTLQIEHVYKLLCAAYHINNIPGYKTLPAPYARSIKQYGDIVGVKK